MRKNQQKETQTVFSNIAEIKYNPLKRYVGYIEMNEKEYLVDHICKFRVQAIEYFEDLARYNGGKFTRLVVVK